VSQRQLDASRIHDVRQVGIRVRKFQTLDSLRLRRRDPLRTWSGCTGDPTTNSDHLSHSPSSRSSTLVVTSGVGLVPRLYTVTFKAPSGVVSNSDNFAAAFTTMLIMVQGFPVRFANAVEISQPPIRLPGSDFFTFLSSVDGTHHRDEAEEQDQQKHKLALHDRRAYFFVRQGGGRRDSKQDPRPPRLVSIPARGRLPKERRAVNLSCVQFGQLRCGVHNNVNHAGKVSRLSGANITKLRNQYKIRNMHISWYLKDTGEDHPGDCRRTRLSCRPQRTVSRRYSKT
jgi:hypothetical protein